MRDWVSGKCLNWEVRLNIVELTLGVMLGLGNKINVSYY